MPIIISHFRTSYFFKNKHVNTVYRTLFTRPKVSYTRQRIPTDNQDFIDLDISSVSSKKAALLIHGLEGSSQSKYILASARDFNNNGIDVVVFNLRGCSGDPNKRFESYHSGETKDLDFVIRYVLKNYLYNNISLVGFSLGGNMLLKYLGEKSGNVLKQITSAIAVSAPVDLKGSSMELAKKHNAIYMKRFLNTLVKNAIQKSEMYPEKSLNPGSIKNCQNFYDFDTCFTAPSFGFESAEDYWEKASALKWLTSIQLPTYFVTAKDDPFLSDSCYPVAIAKEHPHLFLEVTEKGGHIGFIQNFHKKDWLEKKMTNFMHKSFGSPKKN